VTLYVLIGVVEAVTVGMILWGTGRIVVTRLHAWRRSRRRRPPASR
jgi:hypothetical protein